MRLRLLLILFVALHVLDLVTTWIALDYRNLIELNPVMRPVIEAGWWWMIAAKAAAIAIIWALISRLPRRAAEVGGLVCCVVMLGVVTNNFLRII